MREYAIQCIKEEAQAVLDLIPQLDDDFDKAMIKNFRTCAGYETFKYEKEEDF